MCLLYHRAYIQCVTICYVCLPNNNTPTNSHAGKLQSRCRAEDLLEELSVVLDDAAEPFVLKLWRMLVYYSVKN